VRRNRWQSEKPKRAGYLVSYSTSYHGWCSKRGWKTYAKDAIDTSPGRMLGHMFYKVTCSPLCLEFQKEPRIEMTLTLLLGPCSGQTKYSITQWVRGHGQVSQYTDDGRGDISTSLLISVWPKNSSAYVYAWIDQENHQKIVLSFVLLT
jgi:hypothetical protein